MECTLRNKQYVGKAETAFNNDFCQARLSYRKEFWKEVKHLPEEEDKITYLRYRSIVVQDKNNVR